MAENVAILRVQLDEGKTEEQLKQLILDLEATRKAQQALTTERKAGTLADEDFAKRSVELKTQLKGQQQEYTALAKNLDLYRTAQSAEADSYKGTQAQLSLLQNQHKLLEGSQNNSTESTKLLSATIAELRAQLTATDAEQGLFVRNIGNYPKGESLEPLIKQLVLLQEVQKQLPAGSQAAAEAQKQIGFQFGKVNEAAAAAGLAQKDVTNKLADYGERLRPVSADLAKLTIAQDEAAKSAGKDSEAYAKIGFQIGATRQEIAKVPAELAKVPTAADTASSSILGAFKSTGLYSQSVEKAQKFIGQFKTGLDVLKGGFKGVQAGEEAATEGSKVLKIGLAEIGIGLLIIAFTSLVSFFSQSAEGAKILGAVSSALGATFQALTDIVTGTGKAIFQVLSGDFKGAGETVSKTFDGVGTKILDAAKSGYQVVAMEKELIKQRRLLEIEDVKEQSRVAVLLRLSKERGKTSEEQLAALKEAGEIESSITQKNIEQQQKELDLIELKIKLKGSGSKGDLLQQEADAKKGIAQSLAAQDEQNAKIRVRQSVFLEEQRQRRLDDNKAYYDAAAAQAVAGTQAEVNARVAVLEAERTKQLGAIGLTENQKQAIIANSEKAIRDLRRNFYFSTVQQIAALEQQALTERLAKVKINSDEELALQKQKLLVQRNLELAAVDLTVRQRRLINAKYEQDSLALSIDFAKRRLVASLQSQADLTTAELAAQQKGSAQTLQLQIQQIEEQRRLTIAGLNANADNAAVIEKVNAQAAQQRTALEYAAAEAALEDYLDDKKRIVEREYVSGKISENQYQKSLNDIESAGYQAALVNVQDYGQDKAKILKAQSDLEIKEMTRVKAAKEKIEETKKKIQENAFQASYTITDLIIENYGRESTAGQAALKLKQALALAEIGINLQKQLVANGVAGAKISESGAPYTVPLGIAYTVATDALAIAAAAKAVSDVLKYQQGGIAYGPSHEQGGIPLYHRGRPAGIEIEGGEPVLTKGVSQNPLLLSLASTVNQLAGGRALVPNFPVPRMALGGVSQPLILDQLRGNSPLIDSAAIGKAVADSLRKNPPVNRWSDFEKAEARNKFTDTQAST